MALEPLHTFSITAGCSAAFWAICGIANWLESKLPRSLSPNLSLFDCLFNPSYLKEITMMQFLTGFVLICLMYPKEKDPKLVVAGLGISSVPILLFIRWCLLNQHLKK